MTSAKFSPAAATSTRTCPAPSAGSGRSWTCRTSGGPCLVMTTARMAPTLTVEQARRRDLALELEERGMPVGPPDEHQHGPEQQEADPDDQRRAEAEDRRRARVRLSEVVARLSEHPEQHQPAEQREDAGHHEVARGLRQLAPEVPDAGE